MPRWNIERRLTINKLGTYGGRNHFGRDTRAAYTLACPYILGFIVFIIASIFGGNKD